MKIKRIRRLTLEPDIIEVKKSWRDAKLTFCTYRDTHKIEAIINIPEPYYLTYIREKLNEIEEGWKKTLEGQ